MRKRQAQIVRRTKETDIEVKLNIDGSGKYSIETGIPFLDHMLGLFAKHGLFDLTLKAKGDLEVDIHHTNEDVGICLGEVFKKALGDKKGIKRFGTAFVPMDEALARVTIDLSGRPSLHAINFPLLSKEMQEGYSMQDAKHFFESFIVHSGINMNIDILSGNSIHHVLEALFKALGRALDEATQIDPRIKGIPSTKGRI